jgi:hypothetical protein
MLSFEKKDNKIIIKGKTYEIKEKLKEHGGIWNPAMRSWILPLDTDEKFLDTIKPKEYWMCCRYCVIIDYRRRFTSCVACGQDGNTFRVNGGLFTGD